MFALINSRGSLSRRWSIWVERLGDIEWDKKAKFTILESEPKAKRNRGRIRNR